MAATSASRSSGVTAISSLCVLSDEDINDSDKTMAVSTLVGSNSISEIMGIRIELTATATVGTRVLTVEISNSEPDVMFRIDLSTNSNLIATQAKVVECMPNATSAAVGGIVREYIPAGLLVRDGDTIRVYDSAAIDAAADLMVVHVRLKRLL